MKRRDFIKLVGEACAIPAFPVARSQEVARTRRIRILTYDLIWPIHMAGQIGPPFLMNSLPAAL